MELIYNEISAFPLAESIAEANERVEGLIKAFKEARTKGFNKIRFDNELSQVFTAENYSITQWIKDTDKKNLKDLLLGARQYPTFKTEDSWAEDKYLTGNYYFEDLTNGVSKIGCIGLAAAHIYTAVAISFASSKAWMNNTLRITNILEDETTIPVAVNNIFSEGCITVDTISTFVENYSTLELEESSLLPENKKVHLRDDHGKDILEAFAKKLVRSPFVNAIINSLPFNQYATSFIKKPHPNGLIEVVLYWEDKGYGMVIQSTGRNLRETNEIARILTENFT